MEQKITNKSTQNDFKMVPKGSTGVQNGSKIGLGEVWGPSWPQEPTRARKSSFVPPSPPLLGAKMEAKTHPKAVRSRSKNQWFFALLFIWLRDRFWEQIWRVLGVKLRAMLTKIAIIWPLVGKLVEIAKIWKKLWVFTVHLALGASQHPSKIKQISFQSWSKIDQKINGSWDVNFYRFFIDFAPILARFWKPRWLQKSTKTRPKSSWKIVSKKS